PEGGEIVPPDQPLRRRMHAGAVERLGDAPGTAALEGEIGATIDDAIEVMPLDGGKARIEARVHPFGTEDGDGMRAEVGIQRVADRIRVPFLAQIDVSNLTQRMHAGVGATGAVDGGPLPAEAFERGRQHALHGRSVVLDLPADEWPAVIF